MDFKTKNTYIVGRVTYTTSRTATNYTLSYKVELKRTNNYRGTPPTSGWLKCFVYVNGTLIQDGTNDYTKKYSSFEVPNATGNNTEGAWVEVVRGTKTVNLGAYDSVTNHRIGVSLNGYAKGLQADYKEESYTVNAYSVKTKVSTVKITDNKDNTFTVKTTTGLNGTNCDAVDCRVYGMTDNTEPLYSSDKVTIDYCTGKANGGIDTRIFTLNASTTNISKGLIKKASGKTTTIKLKPYTIATDNSYGNNNDGEIQTANIYYYEPPKWSSAPVLSYIDSTKPTPKSKYKVEWGNNKVIKQNTTSIYQYVVELYVKKQGAAKTLVDTTTVTSTSCVFDGINYNLGKGDTITAKVVAYDKYGNGTDLPSEAKESNSITVESLGIMHAKISATEWVEGQAFVYTDKGWKEAVGVYSKVDNPTTGWKESI